MSSCFISPNSTITTFTSIIVGYFFKNIILSSYGSLAKLLVICVIGLINVYFLYKFENKRFSNELNIIKTY